MTIKTHLTLKPWVVHQVEPSDENLAAIRAGTFTFGPSALRTLHDVVVPSTLSSFSKKFSQDEKLDRFVWCYSNDFVIEKTADNPNIILELQGLATIAEVRVNDKCVLTTENMFVSHSVDITAMVKKNNTLEIIFYPLESALNAKKPRPRWKTHLVSSQNLRWFRTTLLGHIPGWANSQLPIGPWKGVSIKFCEKTDISHFAVVASLQGKNGQLLVKGTIKDVSSGQAPSLTLKVFKPCGETLGYYALNTESCDDNGVHKFSETINVNNPQIWWPHTHGDSPLYQYQLITTVNSAELILEKGHCGFNTIEVVKESKQTAIKVNGETIFCRGGCWATPQFNPGMTYAQYALHVEKTLSQAVAAGINMVRVGGTMAYEQSLFYLRCSELGILVFQDLMFANMDYPFEEDGFNKSVIEEVSQNVKRLAQYPCLAVLCGGSEVFQQAAMFGMPSTTWQDSFFTRQLEKACHKASANVIEYFPSSPCGGALPMQTNEGLTHYFGVGAYKQSYESLWQADVKFACECLAFSNAPSDASRKTFFGTVLPQPHSPQWKAGVCRDNAAGWDFSDITDFYIYEIFGEDAAQLKYSDLEKYYRLYEVVTGYVMTQVYSFWRSSLSHCTGGLIWFLNDLAPGAGWGIFDSLALPKPALQIVQQCWQPLQVVMVNRGLNGHYVEVINETAEAFEGTLVIQLISSAGVTLHHVKKDLTVRGRHSQGFEVDALLDQFLDTAYRYRFGPSKIYAVAAAITFKNSTECLSQAVDFPNKALGDVIDSSLSAQVQHEDGKAQLTLSAECFTQSVKIEYKNCRGSKNFFHMLQGLTYVIPVSLSTENALKAKIHCESLNSYRTVRVGLQT